MPHRFTYFNPHHNLMKQVLLLSLFCRWWNKGTERLDSMPKVIQPIGGGPQQVYFQNPCSSPLLNVSHLCFHSPLENYSLIYNKNDVFSRSPQRPNIDSSPGWHATNIRQSNIPHAARLSALGPKPSVCIYSVLLPSLCNKYLQITCIQAIINIMMLISILYEWEIWFMP